MPDRTLLKIGDRVRLLYVPIFDIQQRERELREGTEMPGWTADTIERILLQDPNVTIDRIDEYGNPWFNYDLLNAGGQVEEHTLALMEDDSWTIA